ncbi:MAG: carboxypeptidase regulatory-like domain-containing protein [Candidatus Acidiferrales bacterium]
MGRLGDTLILLFFSFAIPGAIRAQISGGTGGASRSTVSGTIYAQNSNRPIEHATVELCDSGSNVLEQATTTDSGEFTFRGLQRGNFILRISAVGFESDTEHTDLNFNSDRGMSIYLEATPTQPATSAPASTISTHEMAMPERARTLMAMGRKKLYVDKNPKDGLEDFRKAVAIAPTFYEAYYELGMAHVALSQPDDADASFRNAIALSQDKFGEADIALGTLLLNKNDNAGGEKLIRTGIGLRPNSGMGYFELGRALLNENRTPEAQNAAEKARSLTPNSPVVYRLLSNVHLREKNYPALLADLDAYIKLDPDSAAGVRARQLRDQVKQELAKSAPTADGAGAPAAQPASPRP